MQGNSLYQGIEAGFQVLDGQWWKYIWKNSLATALKDLKGQQNFWFICQQEVVKACLFIYFEWKRALVIDAFNKNSKEKKDPQ